MSCLKKRNGSEARTFTLGIHVLTNESASTLTFEDVRLNDPEDIEVESAWLVEIDRLGVGDGTGFPSDGTRGDGVKWDKRVPLEGAVIPPGRVVNVVLEGSASSDHPRTSGVTVDYTADGDEYRWVSKIGFEVKDACF